MIKSIKITNHLGDSLELELSNPYKSGILIESIDGLGPVNASINFTELATSDGAIDNSARLTTREINLSLQPLGKPSVEDSRLEIYRYFPSKQMIRFQIKTDNRECYTMGRVEKNEPDIFSDKETIAITILCPEPYFYALHDDSIVFRGVDPKFKFPFSNNSLTEKKIKFGDLLFDKERQLWYNGDVEVGIVIKIHMLGDVKGLAIYNSGTRAIMVINDNKFKELMGSGIQHGDDIEITTVRGKRRIILIRNGMKYNIINTLDRPIGWITIARGLNVFAYAAREGISKLDFKIEYQIIYEGV